jgi:hypothetical protein
MCRASGLTLSAAGCYKSGSRFRFPVGPWRSWERASMASRRSRVRIPSAPPTEPCTVPRHPLHNVPKTWVTRSGARDFRAVRAPESPPRAIQKHRRDSSPGRQGPSGNSPSRDPSRPRREKPRGARVKFGGSVFYNLLKLKCLCDPGAVLPQYLGPVLWGLVFLLCLAT